MDKWSNPFNNKITKKLLEDSIELLEDRIFRGPWYCDRHGIKSSAEDVAKPDYVPILTFTIGHKKEYLYFSESDAYYFREQNWDSFKEPVFIETKVDDWVINKLFECEPTIYKKSSWEQFVFPNIKKVWPKLRYDNLISVQPMTQPSSLVFYLKHKYGNKDDGDLTEGTV